MTRELEILGRLLRDPARPFVVVLGGLKVSDKITLIKNMLGLADAILIGGAMANAFLAAKGHDVGLSKGGDGRGGDRRRRAGRRQGQQLRAAAARGRRGRDGRRTAGAGCHGRGRRRPGG